MVYVKAPSAQIVLSAFLAIVRPLIIVTRVAALVIDVGILLLATALTVFVNYVSIIYFCRYSN